MVLREHGDEPERFNPRGGPKTARHVEILGNSEVITTILKIATGDDRSVREDRVVPALSRIRAVSQNVATAVVLECQKLGLARAHLGSTWDKVHAAVGRKMWTPKPRPHI